MEKDIEKQVEEIVKKVRTVEFLHGVPVNLPNKTIALLRVSIREALQQVQQVERDRTENILDKYYIFADENGDDMGNPEFNQIIDTIRDDLLNPNKVENTDVSEASAVVDPEDIPF